MVRIIEHQTWQEVKEVKSNKPPYKVIGRESVWCGFIKVDPSGKSAADVEAEVEASNLKYKKDFQDRANELGVPPVELPRKDVHELQKAHAEALREAYGKRGSDAELLTQPKKLDIIKLAKQFDITPGDEGWEDDIVRMVLRDEHIKTEEENEQ